MAEAEASSSVAEAEADSSIAETEVAEAEANSSVAETEVAEAEADSSVAEAEADSSVAEADSSVAETEADSFVAETEADSSVAETEADNSVAEAEGWQFCGQDHPTFANPPGQGMELQTHDELALPTDCERHSLLCLPQLPLTKTRAIELQKLCVSIHVILPIQPQLQYTSVHLLSSWAVISYIHRHHFVCTCMCNSMVCEAMSSSHNEQTALTNWLLCSFTSVSKQRGRFAGIVNLSFYIFKTVTNIYLKQVTV